MSPAQSRPAFADSWPEAHSAVFAEPLRAEAPPAAAPRAMRRAASARSSRRALRPQRPGRFSWIVALARRRGIASIMAIALVGGAIAAGAVRGGQYDLFVAEFGTIPDLAARALGMPIEGVTISGAKELSEDEIFAATGITTRDSLPFLDAAQVRERVKEIPMVREASVRKLYPSRLLIEVEERAPYALWQVNGQVQVISADGMAIDQLVDDRLSHMAFVVGEDANLRVPEYLKILENAGDLREQIRAGVLIAGRRWNIKLESGLEIKLPEREPEKVFANFARHAREMRILDKDLLSVDLRIADRMVVRLSAEAAAARAEAQVRKPRGRGGQT
jgi:cell division protein FtsQ